jgi:hypothetical protein
MNPHIAAVHSFDTDKLSVRVQARCLIELVRFARLPGPYQGPAFRLLNYAANRMLFAVQPSEAARMARRVETKNKSTPLMPTEAAKQAKFPQMASPSDAISRTAGPH